MVITAPVFKRDIPVAPQPGQGGDGDNNDAVWTYKPRHLPEGCRIIIQVFQYIQKRNDRRTTVR